MAFSASAYDTPTQASDGYYEIETPSHLAWFHDYVATGGHLDACARLKADVNLSALTGYVWTPLGTPGGAAYTGTFDGAGYVLSGLSFGTASDGALFGYISGTVQNLTITSTVSASNSCALFVNELGSAGKITSCTANGAVTANANDAAAFCISSMGGTIEKCVNNATITSQGSASGIVSNNASGKVSLCLNKGTVTAGNLAAGITVTSQGKVTDCGNYAEITGTHIAGGIAANEWSGSSLLSCFNCGKVTASKTDGTALAGAIIGQGIDGGIVTNCYYSTSAVVMKGTTAVMQGSGNGSHESSTYGYTADEIKTGKVTRMLNSDNHTMGIGASGMVWVQDIDLEDNPTIEKLTYVNRVMIVKADGKEYFTNILDIYGGSCRVYLENLPYYISGNTIVSYYYVDKANGRVYNEGYFYYYNTTNDTELETVSTTTNMDDKTTYIDGKEYYQISNAGELRWFSTYVNDNSDLSGENAKANAILTADIDLTSASSSLLGGWLPIASPAANIKYRTLSDGYSGTFDGNGHTITNLSINAASDYQGLFGSLNGTVKNLTVSGTVRGHYYCGLLAGAIHFDGKVINCIGNGSCTGTQSCGGIAGVSYGWVQQSVNRASVGLSGDAADAKYFGGIIGFNNGGYIMDCANFGKVTGAGHVGGIAGYTASLVTRSYTVGNLEVVSGSGGNASVGTIAGTAGNNGVIISNCYYLSSATMLKDGTTLPLVAFTGGDAGNAADPKTATEFASGSVARQLNNLDGTSEVAVGLWGQTLTTDPYPVFVKSDYSNVVFRGHSFTGSSFTHADAYLNPPSTLPGDNTMTYISDPGVDLSILPDNFVTKENTARSVVITDGRTFYIPADITLANHVSYTRTCFRDGFHETICLPFAPAAIPDGYELSEFQRVDEAYQNAYFRTVTEWVAGRAYLLNFTGTPQSSGQSVTFSAESVPVLANPESASSSILSFSGAFNDPGASSEVYILGVYTKEGSTEQEEIFKRSTATYSRLPFRSYLFIDAEVPSRGMRLHFGEPSAIRSVSVSASSSIGGRLYDLQGRPVQSPRPGQIYIQNGKKQIYSPINHK